MIVQIVRKRKNKMIYKIKIKDKKSGEEDFVIMGDSYKSFKDHLVNIIDHWTEKWHYENEDKHAKCFGRTLNKEILEIWYSNDKFVSFGGLKMAYKEKYDGYVEEHNKSDNNEACKYLKDIRWKIEGREFINLLLKENRVISKDELKKFQEEKKK